MLISKAGKDVVANFEPKSRSLAEPVIDAASEVVAVRGSSSKEQRVASGDER